MGSWMFPGCSSSNGRRRHQQSPSRVFRGVPPHLPPGNSEQPTLMVLGQNTQPNEEILSPSSILLSSYHALTVESGPS